MFLEKVMMTVARTLAWCGAAVAALSCAAVLTAQGKPDAVDPGSMSGLTAEIRLLRLAVEESSRAQTQTQALGVYLSAQQARLVQVAARLDAARKDLDAASARVARLSMAQAENEEARLRTVKPEDRIQVEAEQRAIKQELDDVRAQEQLARNREAELSQMMQTEDARWADLISRLEQLIKR